MTDTSHSSAARQSLGVGAIIGESFSILFSKLLPIVILGFVPTLIGVGLTIAIGGMSAATGDIAALENPSNLAIASIVNTLSSLFISALVTAVVVLLAYDAKLGREVKIGRYISPALKGLAPIVILSVVAGIAATVAALAFVLPGLWVYAVFYVMVPAVVIDRAGFGALGRSANLTKEYRWPLVGLFILVMICGALVGLVFGFVGEMLGSLIGSPWASVVLTAVAQAIGYGLGGIAVALAYARLREIKEGVSVDHIASVFD